MQQAASLGGIFAICFLAYLAVEGAVAEYRLNMRIKRTLSLQGGEKFTGSFRLLLPCGRFLSTRNERERIASRLQQAGFFHDAAVDSFLLGRTALLAIFWLASIFFIAPQDLTMLVAPGALFMQMAAAFMASRLSEWWLNDRVKTRTARVRRRISEALELLTICVGSGLTFEKALKLVAHEINPVAPEISAEFDKLYSELTISEDREAVLTRFSRHLDVKELRTVAQTLLQSMRYGTPLVDALQTTADQSRLAQLDDIKERAGAAPARMSVPLIVFILFPVIALLGAPAIINLARTMQGIGA